MKAILILRKTTFAASMLLLGLLSSCIIPLRSFDRTPQPPPPDYSNHSDWVALPGTKDSADAQLPAAGIIDKQAEAKADVFFIYPTTYSAGGHWNAELDDKKINRRTDRLPARLQASAFNGSCRVYMPRYRGAILYSYFGPKHDKRKAMDLAYGDVRKAFIYYLEHYNQGRPIVIASHSQGSDHAVRLLREFFDKDTVLARRLVIAYVAGTAIHDTTFQQLKLRTSPSETGGFVTWNTVRRGTNTFYGEDVGKILCVNPLTWKADTGYAPSSLNLGGLPISFDRIDPGLCDAQCSSLGFLWVNRPHQRSRDYFRLGTRFYHKDDYQFFYMNIRRNVQQRIDAYLSVSPGSGHP